MNKFIENTKEYQALMQDAERTAMKDAAFDKWIAYLFMKSADQARYGSLLTGLATQFSMNNDQYPATLTAAMDILANHKLDNKDKFKARNPNNNRSLKDDTPPPMESSFAQAGDTLTCFCCGKKGHTANKCHKKGEIPKEQWWIKKAQQFYEEGKQE